MRERTAWVLWRQMAGEKGETFDRADRWRSVFDQVWPLDANAREPETSRTLVTMALECGFPQAVDAIGDVVVPYDVVTIGRVAARAASPSRGHDRSSTGISAAAQCRAVEAIPPDLGAVLDECLAADLSLRGDPAFVRLDALRRRRAT